MSLSLTKSLNTIKWMENLLAREQLSLDLLDPLINSLQPLNFANLIIMGCFYIILIVMHNKK